MSPFKRISLIPVRRNDAESLEARATYARRCLEILALYDESNLIYVDKVGFNVTLRCCAVTAVHVVAGLRSRNVLVCCAISKTGIINFQVQTTPYNTEKFTAYINSLLEAIANRGPSVIIMHSVPFHKARQIREIIIISII